MNTKQTTSDTSDWLAHRGRFVNVTFMLKKGEAEYLVTIREGRVVQIKPGPHVMPRWTFALVAGDDAWQRFWAPQPQPRFHDLMAMVELGQQASRGCSLRLPAPRLAVTCEGLIHAAAAV